MGWLWEEDPLHVRMELDSFDVAPPSFNVIDFGQYIWFNHSVGLSLRFGHSPFTTVYTCKQELSAGWGNYFILGWRRYRTPTREKINPTSTILGWTKPTISASQHLLCMFCFSVLYLDKKKWFKLNTCAIIRDLRSLANFTKVWSTTHTSWAGSSFASAFHFWHRCENIFSQGGFGLTLICDFWSSMFFSRKKNNGLTLHVISSSWRAFVEPFALRVLYIYEHASQIWSSIALQQIRQRIEAQRRHLEVGEKLIE